jgi:hypothetical protein
MTPDTLAQIAALHTQLATLYHLASTGAETRPAPPVAAVSGPVAAVEAAPLPVVPPAAQRARPAVASPRPAAVPAAAPAPVEPPPAAAPAPAAPAAPAADEVPVAEVLKAMQGHAQRNKAKGGAVATLKSVKGFGGWTTASAVPADKRAALIAHLNSEG